MAKHYVCDNPHCGCTFQIEEVDLYCKDCQPASHAWNSELKQRMAENSAVFAENMMAERAKFFDKRTPKTQSNKPQVEAAVVRGGRGKQKRN
jgi:hypothetical protein